MSKPSLQLIHCSNDIRPGTKRRQNAGGFQPLVIDGGLRSVPGEPSWEAALELFDPGLLALYENYLVVLCKNYRAFLEANMTVLNGPNWTDPEKTG